MRGDKMSIIGIIVEYNPFHNGHLYHLKKIKELYPDSLVIACMSGNFNQRGEVSVMTKWQKTEIALAYGVDLVVELPYVFAIQAADVFAYGGIKILDLLGVEIIVFGSESNDIKWLHNMAMTQVNDKGYDDRVKAYINEGLNYATSMAKGLTDIGNQKIDTPNDLLGLCYIKEIIKQKSKIIPVTIKRTNDYHNQELSSDITSATSIRLALKEKKDVSSYVPEKTMQYLNGPLGFNDNYFELLKYKILSDIDLRRYHTVDEGIEYRLKKVIGDAETWEELIKLVKTKRYTYNRISRMLTAILVGFTKEEGQIREINYIRVLGFNMKGQMYLKKIKNKVTVAIITKFEKNKMLLLEQRVTSIYAFGFDKDIQKNIIDSEFKNKPIRTKNTA